MIQESITQQEKFLELLNEQIEKQLKEPQRSDAARSSLALFERIYRGDTLPQQNHQTQQKKRK